MELAKLIELLLPTKCFLDMCRDRVTVFREISVIKPMDELAKLGDNLNNPREWGRVEKLAKCLEHEFLINCECTQILRLYVSLP